MIYLVFSDESGSKSDSSGYYLRSWLVFDIQSYILFESNWQFIRSSSSKEFKWNEGFELNQHFIKHLFTDPKLNWSIYLSFTDLTSVPDYVLVNKIQEVQHSKSTSLDNFNDAKTKAISAVRNSYFLNTHEVFHYQSMLEMICSTYGFSKKIQPVRIIVDKPQYLEKDLAKVIKTANRRLSSPYISLPDEMIDYEIQDSERSRGIQLADLVAGASREYLNHRFGNKSLKSRTKFFIENVVVARLVTHGNFAKGLGKVIWEKKIDTFDKMFWN